MKIFLIIENDDCDRCEHGRTYEHVVSGETFEEALKKTYFDESIRECVCNRDPEDPWPTNVAKDLGECYVPSITVYEITKVFNNLETKQSLDTYLTAVLADAVEEEKRHLADAPKKELLAKLDALQQAASDLGIDLIPKK